MANTNAVAFNLDLNFNSPTNRGPSATKEPTAKIFNIVVSGGSSSSGDEDEGVGTGPGGMWGTVI